MTPSLDVVSWLWVVGEDHRFWLWFLSVNTWQLCMGRLLEPNKRLLWKVLLARVLWIRWLNCSHAGQNSPTLCRSDSLQWTFSYQCPVFLVPLFSPSSWLKMNKSSGCIGLLSAWSGWRQLLFVIKEIKIIIQPGILWIYLYFPLFDCLFLKWRRPEPNNVKSILNVKRFLRQPCRERSYKWWL